ncbi:LysM peptidoglycan-binding domain-containing protein [Lacinutrix jangbogonensis]|uniref:LysM peptidoglycan-binding domain-containing protein n=1 Tax=Lacinutrix jangbogonensis TaxID=1469557 RepID=UPI00053DE41A|nr:LysM peptidoglycan-binding domain-containing protein [Lacinutrix jangbogonensis]
MKLICKLFVFYFLGSVFGFAQNNIKSHIVSKGENAYRISLKYNVTMDAIFKQNPGSDKVLKVGQTLKIPNSTQLTQNYNQGNSPNTVGTWSPALNSGTGVFDPTVDPPGVYTYTVSNSDSSCGDASASVTVSFIIQPVAGNDGSLEICKNESNTYDLFNSLGGTPDTLGTWLPALSSATGAFDPTIDSAGTYTYTVSSSGPDCSDASATVTVSFSTPPIAGNNGSLEICEDDTNTYDLFKNLGGSPDAGGTWLPSLNSSSGIFDPTIDTPGTYTYTVSSFGTACNDASASVRVSFSVPPVAGSDGSLEICEDDTNTHDLFNSLGNSPDSCGIWTPTLNSGTGVFNPTLDPPGTYTYTVSSSDTACNDASASVSVSFNILPIAGRDGSLEICQDDTNTYDLFNSLGGSKKQIKTSNYKNPISVTTKPKRTTVNVKTEESLNIPSHSSTKLNVEYIDYVITSKETLYGLSQKAGMSINKFLKLNPQLSKSVLIGTIIKMPKNSEISNTESNKPSEKIYALTKQNIITQIICDETSETSNNPTFVENYKIGMQMAIDSIKNIVPNINLKISNTSNSLSIEDADNSKLISQFIIKPFSSETSDNEKFNNLSISTLQNGSVININYKGLTDESEMQKGIIKYLNENDGNKILIYDKDKNDTKEFVESQIANLKTILVNKKGIFNSQDLKDYLNSKTKNYVIIESSRDGVFLSATNTLLKQLANYNIELVVLNANYIPEVEKVSSKRFRILKLIYPSCFSSKFYNEKRILLNNYSENISENDSDAIAFGFGMIYNALYQIYFTEYDNFKGNSSNTLGIPLEYDGSNQQFINKTIFIYRFDENLNNFLLKSYK